MNEYDPLPSPPDTPPLVADRDRVFVDRLSEIILAGLAEKELAKLKKDFDDAATEALDRFEWYIKDDMAANLADYVQQMADRAIEALLAGNDDLMRRYLSCEKTGYNPRDYPDLVRSTGELFEYGGLDLRRKIVEAHAELLKDERVLDLEAQLNAAQQVIGKLNEQVYRLREDAR